MNHISWCINNGIKIYFQPKDNYYGRIVVETNGIGKIGDYLYKNWGSKMGKADIKWGDVIQKLYTYKYLKLGGESVKKIELELEVFLVTTKRKINLKQ